MKHTGATLVEMAVALVILVLLTLGASSALGGLHARYQITAATNNVLGFVHQARAHGLSHGAAYICDGESGCDKFGWTGQLVLVTQTGPDAELLQRLHLPAGTRVKWNGFRGQALYYGPRGHSFFQNGHLLICHHRAGIPPRKIVVNWVGRPRIEAAHPDHCNT